MSNTAKTQGGDSPILSKFLSELQQMHGRVRARYDEIAGEYTLHEQDLLRLVSWIDDARKQAEAWRDEAVQLAAQVHVSSPWASTRLEWEDLAND